MATVPVYQQQVEDKPLPGYRSESIATPAFLGGEADSAAAFGKGLTDVGIGGAAVALHMQERQDMTAILGVETARKEAMIAADADLRKNRQGANADGATRDVKAWWDQAAKDDLASLQTDNQRQVYLRRMAATGHPHILGSECDVLSVPGREAAIMAKVDAFVNSPA